MSAALCTVPYESNQSVNLLRRKNIFEIEETTIGAVIITLRVTEDEQNAALYHKPTRKTSHEDENVLSTIKMHRERSFVAVLAPNCDAAIASLHTQPPGTYLLVQLEDTGLAVYMKFRQAVRALTLVNGNEIMESNDNTRLIKSRKNDSDVTPVYTLCLAFETYCLLEYCWKHYLPHVQAIVVELCGEPHLVEDIKLEDWTSQWIPSSTYAIGLMPEAFGFYIFSVSENNGSSFPVMAVRQVEFDFTKFAIVIADGAHKHSALFLTTSFSIKRTYDPFTTFSIIRDNFLTPDLVQLKETIVNTILPHQLSLRNCIDLNFNDQELTVLNSVEAACGMMMPHEPLLQAFVTELHDMHVCFVNTTIQERSMLVSKPTQWSPQKIKLAGRIIPVLIELLIFSSTYIEKNTTENSKERQMLVQFAYAMHFNIRYMTFRSGDTVICRLVHQICQILSARIQVTAALFDIIQDLVESFPTFLRLFLRNQGMTFLWKNVRHNDIEENDATNMNIHAQSISRSYKAPDFSIKGSSAVYGNKDRKIRWFGLSRKPHITSRKLSVFRANSLRTQGANAFAFFRLRPQLVRSYLGMHLHKGYFSLSGLSKEETNTSLFSTELQQSGKLTGDVFPCNEPFLCDRIRSGLSLNMIVVKLVLQISLRLLYHRSSFTNWDRDVALMIRLKDLHRYIFDEIMSKWRQQKFKDPKIQEINACDFQIAITCVSTLYRLEHKRRLDMCSAIGDKKYLAFVYLGRDNIRKLNECLLADISSNGDKIEKGEVYDAFNGGNCLEVLLVVLTWIPKALLNEWIIFCLKDLLETVTYLSGVMNQTEIPLFMKRQYIRLGSDICQVFDVVLRRMSDLDTQTLLVRLLGLYCPPFIFLLRFLLAPTSPEFGCVKDDVSVQVRVLDFLRAFVDLDIALPRQMDQETRYGILRVERSNTEDAEVLEHLKGELLIQLLGPRMAINDSKQHDQMLWDFILELMFPNTANTVGNFCMLPIAVLFRSLDTSASCLLKNFQQMESFLLLLQTLYIAQDESSAIDYKQCVASHWRQIEQLCDHVFDKEKQDELNIASQLVVLSFRCLVILASQRSHLSEVQEAFNHTRVLSCLLLRLWPRQLASPDNFKPKREIGVLFGNDKNSLSTLTLPPINSFDLFNIPLNTSTLPSTNSQSIRICDGVVPDPNTLLREPGPYALAIVLVLTYILINPNLEIDEAVCPRMYVPFQTDANTSVSNELLWKLQQHLAIAKIDWRTIEAVLLQMGTNPTSVSTARLAAIRLLLRIFCPDRFDSQFYSLQGGDSTREYIAKGAFSAVYRQHISFSPPEYVAVKVIEHQRRAGGLCAVSSVYNEVCILNKLRGNRAVTQLVDFGNFHEERRFEIVMEYCPCSLTSWRASIKKFDMNLSCRLCIFVILRVFEEICQCLIRIHETGVCHFDIKSDNILVRVNEWELSHRLLYTDVIDTSSNSLHDILCFADFGEAKVIDTDQMPARRSAYTSCSAGTASSDTAQKQAMHFVSLTRTRGTEAIKSPEVLKIKGNENAVKITLASDIWSMGCLLYELVTQELLFQNDDWAGLYAHLVVTQDQEVLRSDHKHKVFAALNPTCPEEEVVVQNLLELCSNILVREPSRRPKLNVIMAQVRKLMKELHALSTTAHDESVISVCLQNASKAQESPMLPVFPTSLSCRKHDETSDEFVPVRLFWNFFIAAETITSSIGSRSMSICQEILAMDAFEAKYEHNFVHFVYLSCHDSSDFCKITASQCFIEEVYEDGLRTWFLLNPQLTSKLHWVPQNNAQYFPIFQRCLRDEAGCVVFVALGKNKEDTKALQSILTNMLFFFLRNALDMPAFDILTSFSRDCARMYEYPKLAFLEQLKAYSTTRVEINETSTMVRCCCGSNVLSIKSFLLSEALATQSWTCYSKRINFPYFQPFDELMDDKISLLKTPFIHDNAEKQFVYPLETSRISVQWVTLDLVSITRESGFFNEEDPHFDNFKRQASEGSETGVQPYNEFVRGLQCRGKCLIGSESCELYECKCCRFPICVVGEDKTKVVVPIL
ncbi:putative protein kinase [Plasmopara halstedii]